jgi:Family of unknown function (DUF6755)
METRRQGLTLITAVSVFIGVVVVIQLWLLAAAVDALLGDQRGVLLPSALVSAGLLALNGGLLWYVLSFDRRVQADE